MMKIEDVTTVTNRKLFFGGLQSLVKKDRLKTQPLGTDDNPQRRFAQICFHCLEVRTPILRVAAVCWKPS